MSMRFPHHGSGRHETAPPAAGDAQHEHSGSRVLRDPGAALPDRACCCPAKPMVKAIMPARDGRPPVDLWLCGHHWRASREALAQAGATVYDVSPLPESAGERRESAPVQG